jgi:hypothetical protein
MVADGVHACSVVIDDFLPISTMHWNSVYFSALSCSQCKYYYDERTPTTGLYFEPDGLSLHPHDLFPWNLFEYYPL